MRLFRHAFRAMGTSCELALTGDDADEAAALRALAAGVAEVETCDRLLTRFSPSSDLSRLNAAAGSWVQVDVRLVAVLGAAIDARRTTGGRFDPTILPPLIAAGYDRTFVELTERPPEPLPDWRAGAEIEVDVGGGRARLERGSAVDLGGIGKGFSAARAVDAMRAAWAGQRGAFADLGGDFAFSGLPPDGGAWRVAVADPRHPDQRLPEALLATLALTGGGVATSGRDRRRFGPGRTLHHLIDPATGTPAEHGPLAVTVVAADPTEAEALGTVLAISDLAEGRELARRPGVSALWVPESGEPVTIGPLPLAPRFRIELAA